jgi:hypothetical protein
LIAPLSSSLELTVGIPPALLKNTLEKKKKCRSSFLDLHHKNDLHMEKYPTEVHLDFLFSFLTVHRQPEDHCFCEGAQAEPPAHGCE